MQVNTNSLNDSVLRINLNPGINPDALRGSNTGVYMGVCFEDMDQAMARDINKMEVKS